LFEIVDLFFEVGLHGDGFQPKRPVT